MPRVRLGIVFGGSSEEHDVSVKSAREVQKHLDLARYEPIWIGITKAGAWLLCDGPDLAFGVPTVLSPDRTEPGLGLDLVLPVLHGKLGEDGAVQGLLELAGIPYVGCDVQTSAVCMDKSLTYVVARSAGIATPHHWIVAPGEDVDPGRFSYPVFVKPARSGSSFGVSKVERDQDLAAAVKEARRYDAKVLIEEAVVGSEVGCAILGDDPDLLVGEVDRVALSGGFFRIHQESTPETGSENATFIVPADISAESRALVQETAKGVYRALGCSGLARVDLFLTHDGEVILNEVNTLPGLTSYSRYPRMMAAAGLPLGALIDRWVALTLKGAGR